MRLVTTPSESHPIDDAYAVAAYLDAGVVLWVAAGRGIDAVDPALGRRVPIGMATDGVLAWPLAAAYYAGVHGLAPAPELVAHIRRRGHRPPPQAGDPDDLRAAVAAAMAADVAGDEPPGCVGRRRQPVRIVSARTPPGTAAPGGVPGRAVGLEPTPTGG